jgi:hypothetical protein
MPAVAPQRPNMPSPLTAQNLRAGADEFVDGGVQSTLNRPLGDMTRTFIEGMVPAEEAEGARRGTRGEGQNTLRALPSELNRPLGDMTRTYIEGFATTEEYEAQERRKRERQRRT